MNQNNRIVEKITPEEKEKILRDLSKEKRANLIR